MYEPGVRVLPAIPLRGLVVFPHMVLHFDAGREKTLSAIMRGMETDQLVVLVTQRDGQASRRRHAIALPPCHLSTENDCIRHYTENMPQTQGKKPYEELLMYRMYAEKDQIKHVWANFVRPYVFVGFLAVSFPIVRQERRADRAAFGAEPGDFDISRCHILEENLLIHVFPQRGEQKFTALR